MRGERFKDGLERSGPYYLELLGVSRWMRVVMVKACGYFCWDFFFKIIPFC